MPFYHTVNGHTYTSRAMINPPATLAEYRAAVKLAYGSLRGVKFGELPPTPFDVARFAE